MSVYAKDNPAWIAQALDSVLHNTVSPTEVVVAVDGPVGADIQAVLEEYKGKYPQIKLLPSEKNEGLGAALRRGLLACSYDLVARMDADDISLPDRFERQLARFDKEPDLTILGGAIQEIDAQTLLPKAQRSVPCSDKEIKQFLKSRCPFNHVTVMFRKQDILQAGNYQPLFLVEDYYLWVRCAARNYRMGNLSEIVLNVRVDENMYARRGGWKYFKSNKALQDKLCDYKLISWPRYWFNISVRFCVQVLMPNKLREIFYKKALR